MVNDLFSVLTPHIIICLSIFLQALMGLIKSPRLVFKYKNINIITSNLISIIAFVLTIISIAFLWKGELSFTQGIVVNPVAKTSSFLILFSAIITVLMNGNLLNENRQSCYKYHILLLTAVLGALISVCANDFLTLFVALETMSFSLYFLIAFSRGYSSKEASFKYLITNSVSMALFLFGVSYLLGLSSSLNFDEIYQVLSGSTGGIFYSLATLFIFFGLVMKLAIFPFANWIIDVYAGMETSVLAFISSIPKVVIVCVLLNFLAGIFSFSLELNIVILLMAVITALWANIFAIKENNVKKILACSSAANASYMLIVMPLVPTSAYSAVIFYLSAYIVMNLGVWAYLNLLEPKLKNWKVDSLVRPNNIFLVSGFIVLMLGLAGLPISIGFVSKIYLLYSFLSSGIYYLPIIFVMLGLFTMALYYYIRLLRTVTNDYIDVKGGTTSFVVYLAGLITFILGILPFGLISECINLFN